MAEKYETVLQVNINHFELSSSHNYDKTSRTGNMIIARLPPESLRSRYLCIDHFNKKYVNNVTGQRKRLLRTAVPEPYQALETEYCSCTSSPGSPDLEVQTPQRIYKNRSPFCEVDEIDDVQAEEKLTVHRSTPKRRRSEQNKEDIYTTKYGTRDSITSAGVSQLDEDKVAERGAPQTSKDAPMEIIEEQKSLQNNDLPKSRSEQAAVESTAAVQYSELNRTEELELDEEVQPRANKPNTQTSAEIQRREETIGYTIIANVYHYLKKEYELLKSQLGGRCDLSPLANILKRTAAATGVTQQAVTAALDRHKLKLSVHFDHSYNRGNTRQNEESNSEGLRPLERRTYRNTVKSKPTKEEQLPLNTNAVSGSKTKRKDLIPSYERRTNDEQDRDSEGEGVTPPKRRSTGNSVRNISSNEEELPFPSPIQFRLPEVMEIEFKAEPADECQQTLENDPLWPVSQYPIHCRTPEAMQTETVFKAEPADDECPQDLKADTLETESSPAALEEPSDPSDASEIEMKIERMDEEYPNLFTDYSRCDPALLDIKTESPFE